MSALHGSAAAVVFGLAGCCLSLAGCSVDASGTAGDLPLDDAGDTRSPLGDSSGNPYDGFAPVDSGSAGDDGVDSGALADSTVTDTGAPDTPAPTDTAPPTDTTPPPVDTPPTCDLTACGTPAGTPKRAALVDSTVSCPAGFKSTDVVEAMTGDGCGCTCALTPGTCAANASVSTTYSDDGACGTTGDVLTTGGCKALGTGVGFGGKNFGASVPGPTGQSCTPTKTMNKAAQTRTLHLCEASAGTCFGAVCVAPFAECIEVAGACPAGYPNSRKVGSDLGLTCPMACTCSTTAATCSGTIDFFGMSGCAGTKTSFPVDGGCHTVPSGTGTIRSYQYTPNAPKGGGCSPSFFGAPGTTSLSGTRSFCCR